MRFSLPTNLSCVREILMIAIILYFAQGSLLPQGTIITQIAFMVILFTSLFYCLKVLLIEGGKNLFILLWLSFILLNFFGYLITLDLSNPYYFGQMKVILLFSLPFFPFYFLARSGEFEEHHLLRFFIIMLILSIIEFKYNNDLILSSRLSDNINVVNNTAYYFALLLPYIFLFKKRIFSILSIFVILFFIIQGAKRGALIVGIVGASIFIYYNLTSIQSKNRIVSYFFTIIGIVVSFFYLFNYLLNNEYLIERLTSISDGGSGRDIIFTNLLNNWYNSENILNFVFGYGFSSTIKFSGSGHFAHNDWLELLTNFGILGVGIYSFIFILMILMILSKNLSYRDRFILISVIFMWFFNTLFSMVYTSYSGILLIILLSFLIARKVSNSKSNFV